MIWITNPITKTSMKMRRRSKMGEGIEFVCEKCGFRNTERFNDNVYADVFMKLEL